MLLMEKRSPPNRFFRPRAATRISEPTAMKSLVVDAIVNVAAIAVIVAVTNWLLVSKGASTPIMRGKTRVYSVKRPVRLVGLCVALVFALAAVHFWNEVHGPAELIMLSVIVAFAFLGVWMTIGLVITNEEGIRKRTLWLSPLIRWHDVTEVVFYRKQGTIKIRAKSRELTLDSRFIARDCLLREIADRSKVSPINK